MAGIRAGQRFGDWVTTGTTRLGRGGNGEVWKVRADDDRIGAIKILNRRGRDRQYRLDRFRDEIGFHNAFPRFSGVLPMLDQHIADDLSEDSWYVMPVAVPIREALGIDPEPVEVVTAVSAIAATLDALAHREVFHRDMKPDNLFKLNSDWAIGDFGLVTYPEKDPRTEHGRKLGPMDYMAPEMRRNADEAAPGPADVWALGKTLWVLLTGEDLPLPGPHRPSDPAYALQERITFPFAAELDLLLERATQVDPGSRVTMAEVRTEISAYLLPPVEVQPSADLDNLRARVAAITERARQSYKADQELQGRHHAAFVKFNEIVSKAATDLGESLNFDVGQTSTGGNYLESKLGALNASPYYSRDTVYFIKPWGQQIRAGFEVVVAMALRAAATKEAFDLAVVISIDRHVNQGYREEIEYVYDQVHRNVPVSSAQQARILTAVRVGLMESLVPVMRKVITILQEET